MKSFVLATLAITLLGAPTFAQSDQPKPSTTTAPSTADIQRDRNKVKQDRTALKADQAAGRKADVAKDQAELKKDRAQLQADMKAAGITPKHHKKTASHGASSSAPRESTTIK